MAEVYTVHTALREETIEMSWSISSSGEVSKVKNEIPQLIAKLSYIQNEERELMEQAGNLAVAVISKNDESKVKINVKMHGSASIDGNGKQYGQSIGIAIGYEFKK